MYPGRGNNRNCISNSSRDPEDVYNSLKKFPFLFKRNTRFSVEEFGELVNELAPFILLPRNTRLKFSKFQNTRRRLRKTKLTVQNRVLLVILWLKNYPTYPMLAAIFGVTEYVISEVLDFYLYFKYFIILFHRKFTIFFQ